MPRNISIEFFLNRNLHSIRKLPIAKMRLSCKDVYNQSRSRQNAAEPPKWL